MRTTIVGATFLLLGASASAVGALDMLGSDTMGDLTKAVINNCSGAAGINYLGTGSGNGETGMQNGTQLAASMSRFIRGTAADPAATPPKAAGGACAIGNGANAEGLAVALDAVAIAANTTNSNGCGGVAFSAKSLAVTDRNTTAGIQCPGCDASNNYVSADFADFLRLLYFGVHHDASKTRDCDSDARRALVADYQNLFQGSCGSSACAGKPLKHAWRRDDASGTTDTFIGLIGGLPAGYALATKLPSSATAQQANPFCNAGPAVAPDNFRVVTGSSDFQDRDPIRVACEGNGSNTGEQVCQPDGTLGVVLPIFPPDTKDVPAANTYATQPCTTGEVELLTTTKTSYTGLCPNGAESFGGKCFASVIRNPDGTFNANCIQVNKTANCPFLTPAGKDCRGSNLWARTPEGPLMKDNSLGSSRFILGAFYRLHTTKFQAGGSAACTKATATEQIGCLAGNSSPCSVGFAGRAAVDPPGTAIGLTVKGIDPSVDNIQKLILDSANKYPLSRKLYYTSAKGFGSASGFTSGAELELAKCLVDDTKMAGSSAPNNIIAANGFVALPLQTGHTTRSLCEDFDESICGTTPATNGCSDNASVGLPTN